VGKWRGFILLQAMKKTIQSVVALSTLSTALLSGCAPQAETELPETVTETPSAASYKDGSYTATGSYASPAGMDTMGVTLVIENDIVKSVSIDKQATNEGSIYWQGMFADGISALVVGKSLDSIENLSAVNGSSLTPKGFAEALELIKAEAQA
jgi:hypothetical protein